MSRPLMMALGALLAIATIIAVALALPQPVARKRHAAKCEQSAWLSPLWFCGTKVVWHNPDGSRVVIGTTKQLRTHPSAHPLAAP